MKEEKRPDKRNVLKIEKNAEREITFHYNREERLSMSSAPVLDYGRRNIFKNNRSLLILFLDVIIVIIIMFIAVRFFLGVPYRGGVGDYSFELKAFIYSEKVYVVLVVEKIRTRGEGGGFGDVSFYLKGEKTHLYTLKRQLPVKKGERKFVRVQIPFSGEETTVYALVKVNGKEVSLHRKVQR